MSVRRVRCCVRGLSVSLPCLLLASALFCAPTAAAQEAEAPPGQTSEASAATVPTVEEIKGRIEQIEADAALDEDARNRLVELYREALKHLSAAQAASERAASLKSERERAPGLLKTIREQLDGPSPVPQLDVPRNASVEDIQRKLDEAQASLEEATARAQALDEALKTRPARRADLPKLIAETRQNLQDVTQKLQAQPAAEADRAAEAERLVLQAQRQSLESKLAAYSQELDGFEEMGKLLTAQRDQALRRASAAEKQVKALADLLTQRRQEEARQASLEARRASARAHPALKELAEKNLRLAEMRTGSDGLPAKIKSATQAYQRISEAVSRIQKERKTVRRQVERAAGLYRVIGPYLRKKRAEVPDVRDHAQNVRRRLAEILELEIQKADYEEERTSYLDLDGHLKGVRDELSPSISDEEVEDVMGAAKELLQARREYLEALVEDMQTYYNKLNELNDEEGELVAAAKAYADYIDEHIFWLRSTSAIGAAQARQAWEGIGWLIRPGTWLAFATLMWEDLYASWPLYGLLLIGLAASLLLRRRMWARLAKHSELAGSAETDSLLHTLEAGIYALIMSAPLPLVLWFLAWRIAAPLGMPDLGMAVAEGLNALAPTLLVLLLLIKVCDENGLAALHFRWRNEAVQRLRRTAYWLAVVGLPPAFLHSVLEHQANQDWRDSLGRALFILLLVVVGLLLQRLLKPSGPFVKDLTSRSPAGLLARSQYLLYGAALILPPALAGAAALGYYYTARQLANRFEATLLLAAVLLLTDGVLKRLIFVLHRRLSLRQAREMAQARREETSQGAESEATETVQPQERKIDLHAFSVQSKRLVTTFVVLGLLAGLWTIWSGVLPALGALDRIELWRISAPAETGAEAASSANRDAAAGAGAPLASSGPEETTIAITLADLLLAVIVAAVTVIAAKNIPGLIEMVLLRRLLHEDGLRFAITVLAKYAIILVGTIAAFKAVGIGWAKVQWLAAAITFGLAFGLQEIVANFVSGLIILFERPLRLGDVVTIGDTSGTVTQIRIRATTITDFDRKELVVPNKDFVTGRLVNWTLSDQMLRIVIPVGIAYGSDTALARRLLLKVADENPVVLKTPAPQALFMDFGSSSLDFELRIYIATIDHYLRSIDELHTAIDNAFRAAGVEIAFPQQDVHLRSVHTDIPLVDKGKQ